MAGDRGGIRGGIRVAPLAPRDLDAARELLAGERPRELLERAIGGTRECLALAVTRDEALVGVALYGEVAGTARTGAVLWVAVAPGARGAGAGRALVESAVASLHASRARLVVAELADDAAHAPMLALLRGAGFDPEGAVADFYRDGVALTLWVRRLE